MRIENMINQVKYSLQILPTSSVRNVWRQERRICNLIVGLKGLRYNHIASQLEIKVRGWMTN